MGTMNDDGKKKMWRMDDDERRDNYGNLKRENRNEGPMGRNEGMMGMNEVMMGTETTENDRGVDDRQRGAKADKKNEKKKKNKDKKDKKMTMTEKGNDDDGEKAIEEKATDSAAGDSQNVYVAAPSAGKWSMKSEPAGYAVGGRSKSFSDDLPLSSHRPPPPLPPVSGRGRRLSLSDNKSDYAEILD